MLQRVQSIFLFFATLFFAGLLKFPFATTNEAVPGIFSDRLYNVFDNPILTVLVGLGILVTLASIFVFKNRILQSRLGYVSIILSIFTVLTGILIFVQNRDAIPSKVVLTDGIGIYLPIAALICTALAIRFINKDESLVRSMDRLR